MLFLMGVKMFAAVSREVDRFEMGVEKLHRCLVVNGFHQLVVLMLLHFEVRRLVSVLLILVMNDFLM